MRRNLGRGLRAAAILALGLAFASAGPSGCGTPPVGSQWQGGVPGIVDEAPPPRVSRFLVLDSGGSGGMFGQGDLRANLLDVAFWSDGMHGAACGDAGVFYSADGGLSWTRIRPSPRKEYPDEVGVRDYQVEMSGPREIWIAEGRHPAAGRRLWHSTDAGQTWEDAAPRFPGKFESVWDLLARGPHVWLLGGWAPKASYRSDDGGRTWQRLAVPDGVEPYRAVTPAGGPLDRLETVFLLGARREGARRLPSLFRSDDGGRTWREIALPSPGELPWNFSHATLAFATPEAGMIGLEAPGLKFPGHGVFEKDPGATAGVLVTADGGATWTRRDLPDEELAITCLWGDPANPRHALAGVWNQFVTQNGGPRNGPALYETFDAGRTWGVAIRGQPHFNAIFGLDSRRVWAVGDLAGFAANDVIAILDKTTQE